MLKQTFLFTFCFILVGVISSGSLIAQEAMKLDKAKKHSHEIPMDSAKKFIGNLKRDAMQMKTKGGMFYREGIDKLLAQKGCVGIRYYYAKTDDGDPTIVLVGVDSSGKDIYTKEAVLLERSYPCPPYCD